MKHKIITALIIFLLSCIACLNFYIGHAKASIIKQVFLIECEIRNKDLVNCEILKAFDKDPSYMDEVTKK